MTRRICVFTGTRAEYGLLRWLLQDLRADPEVELRLLVSGSHLSPSHGSTVEEIERDGFTIDERVEMLVDGDSASAVAKSLGLATIGYADALQRLAPDILVVLGDRFEALAAVQTALLARIPVAHLHGGETSEGAVDESIRHAITKLSHLHFVAAEPFRRRVEQLGEDPERVHVVGAPGLDALVREEGMSREALEASLGHPLGRPTFAVTHHPATLAHGHPADGARALLDALDGFPEATVVFTMPNADAGNAPIRSAIAEWVARRPERASAHASLGHRRYLSLLREADVVIGNSSSGLIEAPAVHTATVDVGPRQQGRLHGPTVLRAAETSTAIAAAVEEALSPSFASLVSREGSPYGDGDASRRIARVLKGTDLDGILVKRFHVVRGDSG